MCSTCAPEAALGTLGTDQDVSMPKFEVGRKWAGQSLGQGKEISWESRNQLSWWKSMQAQYWGCFSSLLAAQDPPLSLGVMANCSVRIDCKQQ